MIPSKKLLGALATLVLPLAVGCGSAPGDGVDDVEGAATTGTPRPQRVVLIQAEPDGAQTELFRSYNATLVLSTEARILWAGPTEKPSVQENFDALIDRSIARIEAELVAKEKQNPKYEETIVLGLAGHSTGFSFFGHYRTTYGNTNYARLQPEGVQALAAKYPHFAKNVRALLLLGCNAGHKDKMELWRRPFANVTAVAGFNSRAPDGASGANQLVRWSLGAWQRLGILNANAKLPTSDEVLFRDMQRCRETKCLGVMVPQNYGGTVSFVVQGSPAWELIVGGTPRWDAVFPPEGPAIVLSKLQLLQPEYDAYLRASDDAHADPPANTSSGLVRQYNNLAQQYLSALRTAGKEPTAADVARVQQSIRLTLFKDLQQAWIEANAALVERLGLDPATLSTATRRKVLQAIANLPWSKKQSADGQRLVKAMVELDPIELPDELL
jgi:hypothetical protein